MKKEFAEGYINKLKSKLFGLLCEFEKNGEWEKFLDSIITELVVQLKCELEKIREQVQNVE